MAFAPVITAPEYHLGETPTNRPDIYSLGVVVYEMLTGKLPYREGFSSARSIARLKPIPANALDPSIPAWVSAALAKATHRDPDQRYDALSAFMHDLERPNPGLANAAARPLIDRNPLAFWKWLTVISLLVNFALLFALSAG